MPAAVRRRTVSVAAVMSLAIVATSCSTGSAPRAASGDGVRSSTAAPAGGPALGGGENAGGGGRSVSQAVPQILDFSAPLVGGGTLEGSDLAGAPVAFWFWAPW
jgi:hypothetical protein